MNFGRAACEPLQIRHLTARNRRVRPLPASFLILFTACCLPGAQELGWRLPRPRPCSSVQCLAVDFPLTLGPQVRCLGLPACYPAGVHAATPHPSTIPAVGLGLACGSPFLQFLSSFSISPSRHTLLCTVLLVSPHGSLSPMPSPGAVSGGLLPFLQHISSGFQQCLHTSFSHCPCPACSPEPLFIDLCKGVSTL